MTGVGVEHVVGEAACDRELVKELFGALRSIQSRLDDIELSTQAFVKGIFADELQQASGALRNDFETFADGYFAPAIHLFETQLRQSKI